MTDFLRTVVEINCAIVVLFLVWKLVQRRLSFSQQRFALVSIPMLAVAAALVKKIPLVAQAWGYRIPVTLLEPVAVTRHAGPSREEWFSFDLLYWIGVAILALVALAKLFRIFRLFLTAETKSEEGCKVTEIPRQDSFSFFRFIQLKPGLDAHDRAIVFRHERLHARKLHSLDLLYFEAVHCFGWFNPVFPLVKKELIQVHEFEVDRIMYDRYKTRYMEFLVAYSLGTSSSSYLFTHQFLTKLTLIKRINSMKNTTKKRWILVLALPLVAGSLTLVSWTTEQGRSTGRQSIRIAQEPVKIETEVDKMPEFKGGMEAMTAYLTDNIRYPEKAVKENTTGSVMVGFVVTKAGKITNVTIKRGVSAELDAEAKRVVGQMPDWIPAEKAGKKVDSEMILPIAFQL
jgi:TonB family protein